MRQEVVAYLGSIDARLLEPGVDARASIPARVDFWNGANPKLKALVNRLGGEAEVKRHRLVIHAHIPWPKQPERDRLKLLEAEEQAAKWHGDYQVAEKVLRDHEGPRDTVTKAIGNGRQIATEAITQANIWSKKAAELRKQLGPDPPPAAAKTV